MDRLRQLEVLSTAVRTGSLSAAARELRLSPAGASGAIRELEAWLGARVLNRTTRALTPTEAGADLLLRGERIASELDAARAAAAASATQPRGRVRVSAPVSYGLLRLGPVLAAYLAEHPDIELSVDLTDRRVDVVADRYDLAIRIGHALDPGLVARRLARHRLVLCASPAYLERRGAPAAPDDLAGHDCLVFTERTPVGRWTFRNEGGRSRIAPVKGRMESDNGLLLRDAALAGLGLVLAPDFLIVDEISCGRLVETMLGWRSHDVAAYSVRPAGAPPVASVARLIAHLVRHLR